MSTASMAVWGSFAINRKSSFLIETGKTPREQVQFWDLMKLIIDGHKKKNLISDGENVDPGIEIDSGPGDILFHHAGELFTIAMRLKANLKRRN